MKASLKFREEQRPLWRAKVPISILGLPFLSGLAAGEARELRLDLATAFESGPTLRASYRPNDPWNPFSFVLKTGTGALGSPAGAPMAMSAEFSLLGRGGPAFRVLFKPRFGDFALKKTVSSAGPPPGPVVVRRIASADQDALPAENGNGIHHPDGNKPNGLITDGFGGGGGGGINALLAGTELSASSALPLSGRTAVRFRWGLTIPPQLHTAFDSYGRDRTAGIPLGKLPLLVMSKMSIEYVAQNDKQNLKTDVSKDPDQVAEACLSVKRQLEALQAENGLLRRAVEELRAEVGCVRPAAAAGGQATPATADASKNGAKPAVGKRERWGEGKPVEVSGTAAATEDVNEELKKALMGAAAGAGK